MFHVADSEQSQFLQLTSLSLIDKIGSFEWCTAERATIIALDGEGSFRNKVSARKCRSLEASPLAKDIGNESDKMVCKCFICRNIPTLYERCPVELNTHNVIDALSYLGKTISRNSIQSMKQFLTNAETGFL